MPVAAANARRGPVLSVAEYGQLGTSNDSATFQAALNAAAAAGGATVVAPQGAYRVTGLRVGSGVKVWFPGVTLVKSSQLTARSVLDAARVVATQGALERLQEALA